MNSESSDTMRIRPETPADHDVVRCINEAAFPSPAEARLVDALRPVAQPCVSLVAYDADNIVGHILFTPVTLENYEGPQLMGLAPMAVAPDHQRAGVGSQLVRAGLEACRVLGCGAVVVLGHPEYYPRFGFVPSVRHDLTSVYDVPDEVFMVLELEAGCLKNVNGTIHYHGLFNEI